MKYHLQHEQNVAIKNQILVLEKQARETLNELYKLKAHKQIKKLIGDMKNCYRPNDNGVEYDLEAVVDNPVLPETKARMDKLILNK